MKRIVLDNIPFQIDVESLLEKLHVEEESIYADELSILIRESQEIAKPKALYRISFVDATSENYIAVDGVAFRSRVLRMNLKEGGPIFPFIATCGIELDAWADKIGDVLRRFWAEAITEMALGTARDFLEQHLLEQVKPGRLSSIAPGCLKDWPIGEQRTLFSLLGNTKGTVGVQLTDSLLMIPTKSVSGVYFPTEESFCSCQLCPRKLCHERKASHDKNLYHMKFPRKRVRERRH